VLKTFGTFTESQMPTAQVLPFERRAKRPSARQSLNVSMLMGLHTSILTDALRSPGTHLGFLIVPVVVRT
jgi:hypothetical protein